MEPEAANQDPTVLYQEILNKHVLEIEILVNALEKSNTQVEQLGQVVKEQSNSDKTTRLEISRLRRELQQMKSEHDQNSKQLQNAMERLGKVSPRNVTKKIKRRDEMNAMLKEKTKQQNQEISLIENF